MISRPEITRSRPDDKEPTCFERETGVPCMSTEVSQNELYLFPYQHFVSARLAKTDSMESLQILFSSHLVVIEGSNLEVLFGCLQEFAVKSVSTIPMRYSQLASSDSTLITDVRVQPVSA